MKKNEYLNEFSNQLSSLDYQSKQDIIYDFEEHFSIGLAAGKTEEQICAELGSPIENARQYLSGEKKVAYVQPQATFSQNPNAPYAQGYQQNTVNTQPINSSSVNNSNDRTAYTVLLIVSIFIGVCFSFPVGFGFCCAFFGLCVAGAVSGAFVASFALAGFLISLGLIFLCVGMILILLNSWAISYCAKRLR